jgi:hypothetical protein
MAYVGKALVQERCKSLDAFVDKQIAIGSKIDSEVVSLPADDAHIQEMVDKYAIKDYLSGEEIRKLYDYDLSYETTVPSCKRKYERAEVYWNNHKLLSRAEKFAKEKSAKILRAKETIFSMLASNTGIAEKEDEAARKKLQERYAAHIAKADEEAAQLHADAEVRRELFYQQWEEVVRTATELSPLESAAHALAKLEGYKDSQSLIELSNKRIDEITAAKAAEAEAQRLEAEAEAARLAAIKEEEERLRAIAAKERAKKIKKICIIVAAIACAIGIAIAVVLKLTELKFEDTLSWTTVEAAEAMLTDGGEGKMDKTRMAWKTLYVDLDEKEDFLGTATFNYYYKNGRKDVTSAKNYLNKVKTAISETLGEPKANAGSYVWTKDIIRVELIDSTKTAFTKDPAVSIVITYRDQDLCKHPSFTDSHKDATCTEEGYDRHVCTVCYFEKEENIPAFGHSYKVEITKKATCTATGVETSTCSTCNDVKTRTIARLPHNRVNRVTKAATCTANGVLSHICTGCGDTTTESIPKTGHTMTTATCEYDSYCTKCFAIGTRAYGHDYRYSHSNYDTSFGQREWQYYYVCNRCGHSYYTNSRY